ncbi:MAG: hypothetical protein PHW50_00205, partial [Patescibacteria group bacterium]|nr:hypothetical protein [Patescibacteria group bacterium]
HCIINATKFYSQPVLENKDVYLRMIKKIEETIINNFFETILDMRIEFLVCAKLIGYKSRLETIINNEAERSLSTLGNYLIDLLLDREMPWQDNIIDAEHTNVLYLMEKLDKLKE